jgi:hypothetical protein
MYKTLNNRPINNLYIKEIYIDIKLYLKNTLIII